MAGSEPLERECGENASYFRNAPACVAVFVSQYESIADRILAVRGTSDPEAKRIQAFRRLAPSRIQSAVAAISTLLLVFHAMGLRAVWLGAPFIAKGQIEELLYTREGVDLVTIVAVGHPDKHPQKNRKPVSEMLEFIR